MTTRLLIHAERCPFCRGSRLITLLRDGIGNFQRVVYERCKKCFDGFIIRHDDGSTLLKDSGWSDPR